MEKEEGQVIELDYPELTREQMQMMTKQSIDKYNRVRENVLKELSNGEDDCTEN